MWRNWRLQNCLVICCVWEKVKLSSVVIRQEPEPQSAISAPRDYLISAARLRLPLQHWFKAVRPHWCLPGEYYFQIRTARRLAGLYFYFLNFICGIWNWGMASSFWNHVIQIWIRQVHFQDIYSHLQWKHLCSGGGYRTLLLSPAAHAQNPSLRSGEHQTGGAPTSVPDPWHFGVDPDPDPSIFITDLQDAKKLIFLKKFSCILLFKVLVHHFQR